MRGTFVFGLILALSAVSGRTEKPPFKILYNSDTTHILSCISAWRPTREKLATEMFRATVDEAAGAGADVLLMAPGLGWVPWWPSRVLPLDQHAAWFREHYHLPKASNAFLDYAMQGNDMVQITLDRCHEKGIAFFISYRLNDVHGKDTLDKPTGGHMGTVPQFYADHPEFLLGQQTGQTSWAKHLQNWAHPEVRDFKFKLIEELCRNYDIDGLELDFMRAPFFFRLSETTSEQRREIMLAFVKRVRQVLDETARSGKHRWLSVRIPSSTEPYDSMGIDVPAWNAAGVEMFNLSAFLHTEQTNALAEIRQLAPNAAVYLELTQIIAFNGNNAARSHRRMTRELFDTSAHLAYAKGADGVALFNFQYFRDFRDAKEAKAGTSDGPYGEPPFEVVRELGQPSVLATRPQHYYQGVIIGAPRRNYPFPAYAETGTPLAFALDLAPPVGGWKKAGRLRLQSDQPLAGREFTVAINGTPLEPSPDVSEPYPSPYTQMVGKPEELRVWTVPVKALRAGRNTVTVTLAQGDKAKLIALDLALP